MSHLILGTDTCLFTQRLSLLCTANTEAEAMHYLGEYWTYVVRGANGGGRGDTRWGEAGDVGVGVV